MGDGLRRAIAATKRTRMDHGKLDDHLRSFARDGMHGGDRGKEQKKMLKAAGYVEHSHGSWHLTPAGRAAAERLGHL